MLGCRLLHILSKHFIFLLHNLRFIKYVEQVIKSVIHPFLYYSLFIQPGYMCLFTKISGAQIKKKISLNFSTLSLIMWAIFFRKIILSHIIAQIIKQEHWILSISFSKICRHASSEGMYKEFNCCSQLFKIFYKTVILKQSFLTW